MRPVSAFERTGEQNLAAELRALRAEVADLRRTRQHPLPDWTLKEVVDSRGRHLGALHLPTGTLTVLAEAP